MDVGFYAEPVTVECARLAERPIERLAGKRKSKKQTRRARRCALAARRSAIKEFMSTRDLRPLMLVQDTGEPLEDTVCATGPR